MNTHVCEETRREIVELIEYWRAKTTLTAKQLSTLCALSYDKFLRWRKRLQEPRKATVKVIPSSHWLLPEEVQAIVRYAHEHPGHGYRRLAWMLIDDDVAYASPSTVYRILKAENLLTLQERKPSRKGKGFEQPTEPHEHWHVDYSYFKIGSVFYYFVGVLDGYSRTILAWDLRTKMEERDAEAVLQKAKEIYPEAKPRIISDQGSQFRGNDFKKFVTDIEATHVMTSPYYPQSNGKLERFHLTLKEHAYKKLPLDLEDGKRIVGEMIDYYNRERLHSAIDYVTPEQCLTGQRESIKNERQRKLREAIKRRREKKALENQDNQGELEWLEEANVERAEERSTVEYSSQVTTRPSSQPEHESGAEGSRLDTALEEPAMPPNLPAAPAA